MNVKKVNSLLKGNSRGFDLVFINSVSYFIFNIFECKIYNAINIFEMNPHLRYIITFDSLLLNIEAN